MTIEERDEYIRKSDEYLAMARQASDRHDVSNAKFLLQQSNAFMTTAIRADREMRRMRESEMTANREVTIHYGI